MSIESLLNQMSTLQDSYELTIPVSWGQGRTAYGGISAALCFQAAQNHIEDQRTPRSFHCNFIGPVTCGEPLKITSEILRTGKNVTQIVASVLQNDRVCVMAQICFGVSRGSILQKPDMTKHELTVPKKGNFLPQIPKLVPKFIQHFELAVEKGSLALGKSDQPVLHGWSKLKHPPAKMTYASLIAVMDAWPPTMYQMKRIPAPASTMSWDLEFISPIDNLNGEEWIASVNEARHIENGYGHEESTFWAPDGSVLAYSRQVVAIFA